MENFDQIILDASADHDHARARLLKAQKKTLRIAVHYPYAWEQHGQLLKKLALRKINTFKYIQELCEDICLKDIHHLIKS